jgi:UPF0271 protein
MRAAVDTSALIYLNDFRNFDEVMTVQEVLDESRDRITKIKLQTVNPSIFEPSKAAVAEVDAAAKSTGDAEKLSKTDIKLIALAKERDATIISDDYGIQNVAEKLGIEYMSISNRGIKNFVEWKKHCSVCDKDYKSGSVCKTCGSRLKRVPAKSERATRGMA